MNDRTIFSPSQPPALYKLIGNTPLVEVTRLDTGPCQLFLKLDRRRKMRLIQTSRQNLFSNRQIFKFFES